MLFLPPSTSENLFERPRLEDWSPEELSRENVGSGGVGRAGSDIGSVQRNSGQRKSLAPPCRVLPAAAYEAKTQATRALSG